jgi:hypothetical protein
MIPSIMDHRFQYGLQIHLVLLKNTWDEGGKWGIRIISELETSLPHFASEAVELS